MLCGLYRNNQTQVPNVQRMYQDQLAERQRRNENLPATETVLGWVGSLQ